MEDRKAVSRRGSWAVLVLVGWPMNLMIEKPPSGALVMAWRSGRRG